MDKSRIDEQAERESRAIYQLRDIQDISRRRMSVRTERIRQQTDYNESEFQRLFKT